MNRTMLILTMSLMTLPAQGQQVTGFYSSISPTGTIVLTNVRSGPEFTPLRISKQAPQKGPRARVQPAYSSFISSAAALHELPEALLHAVIRAESGYNALALSPRGAVGLMQLMPATAIEMGVEDIWDPASNIAGGARYLKSLMSMFDNDIELALAAYNAGPGAVEQYGRTIPPFAETRTYVPKVLRHYRQLQAAHQAN